MPRSGPCGCPSAGRSGSSSRFTGVRPIPNQKAKTPPSAIINTLTAEQVFRLSETFAEPFPTVRRTQARLGQLAASGMLLAWRYSTIGQGSAPHYYKLSPESFRLLFGHEAQLPSKRFLHEVKVSQQEHKRLLGDFTVHTAVAAHRRGFSFVYFHPENTHRIETADGTIFPDQAFGLHLHLRPATQVQLNFHVELDNSTEPVRSLDRLDSWQNRLRRYYQNEASNNERSRLIIVSTKNGNRLANILDLARRLNPTPSYSMAIGVFLSEYLAEPDPFFAPCFLDQHNARCRLCGDHLQAQPGPCYPPHLIGRPPL